VSRRVLPPFQRDIFFLALGGAWGTWTVYTAGPWPLMLISAATMLGPGFLRLWLSGPGTRGSLPSQRPEPPEPPDSSSPGSSALESGAEAA
jgi:hypothetical protein